MKVSDLFVAALVNEGVDRIFGIPGEENLAVVEALRTSRSSWSSRGTSRRPPSWRRPTAASLAGPASA